MGMTVRCEITETNNQGSFFKGFEIGRKNDFVCKLYANKKELQVVNAATL